MPGDRDLLGLLHLDTRSPVLLLEGTSYDQDGRPVEVFSTWYHPNHVGFDMNIQREPVVSAILAGPVSSPAVDTADAIANKALQLGTELLNFANQLSDTG